MDWIRIHYERVAGIAAVLFLLCCSVFIWRSAAQFGSNFSSPPAPAPKPAAPPTKATEMAEAAKKIHQPAQWTFGGRSGLFVPEKHFIGSNGVPTTLKNTEVHPPVPNEWLEEFGLPIADSDVLTQDPDGDGFNNLDEWQGHTNPTDKISHPKYITKLKLKSYAQEPFRLVFSSWVGDTYAINRIDPNQKRSPMTENRIDTTQGTQFLKVGDVIRSTSYQIEKFAEKYDTDRFGTRVDVSELTLLNQQNQQEVVLARGKEITSPESTAHFVYQWNNLNQEFVKRTGDEFSLKPEEQIKYKLVDVAPGKAVVINTEKPSEPIEISQLTP